MSMSQARFNAIFNNMTSAARKVYEAVPIQDEWNTAMIIAELQRVGIGMDYRLVAGCINSLIKAGLVCEPNKGTFRREAIREVTEKTTKEKVMSKPVAVDAAKPIVQLVAKQISPLDRLGELAQRAVAIRDLVNLLAADIGDAAVEIQAQLEANDENLTKMRQLATLLKSFEVAA